MCVPVQTRKRVWHVEAGLEGRPPLVRNDIILITLKEPWGGRLGQKLGGLSSLESDGTIPTALQLRLQPAQEWILSYEVPVDRDQATTNLRFRVYSFLGTGDSKDNEL